MQAEQLPDVPQAGAPPAAGGPRSFQAASLGALVERQMGRYGDRPFLTEYDDGRGERVELSYRTFENWTAKIANLLVEELDVAEGARVAVVVGNTWRALAISFACWRAGVGVLPLDPAAPAERTAALLRDRGAAAAFVADERLAGVAAALRTAAAGRPPLVAVGGGLLGRSGADPATAVDFGAVVLGMGDVFDAAGDLASEALAFGRGGLTQLDLLAAAGSVAGWLRLRDTDRLLSGLPAYQRGGVVAGLAAFAAGGGVVLGRGFDPGAFWKRAADEKVAAALLLAEQAEAVLGEQQGGGDLGRLRTVACVPGPVPQGLAAAWAERFSPPLSAAPADLWEGRP